MGSYRARSISPLYYQQSSLFVKSLPITSCQSTIRGHRFAGAYKESFRGLYAGTPTSCYRGPFLKGLQPHFVVVQSPDFKVTIGLNATLSLPRHIVLCPATNVLFVSQVSLLSPLSLSCHCHIASSNAHISYPSPYHIGSVSRSSVPGPSSHQHSHNALSDQTLPYPMCCLGWELTPGWLHVPQLCYFRFVRQPFP